MVAPFKELRVIVDSTLGDIRRAIQKGHLVLAVGMPVGEKIANKK